MIINEYQTKEQIPPRSLFSMDNQIKCLNSLDDQKHYPHISLFLLLIFAHEYNREVY